MTLAARPPFGIGRAELFPATRELAGPGAHVKIEPRVLRVLIVLADAAPALVSRDELFRSCWSGVIVEESALNRAIAQVRRGLLKTGAGCSIETIAKAGYRLVASQESVEKPAKTTSRRQMLVAGGVLAASGAMLPLTWRLRRHSSEQAMAEELHRRAVDALRDMLPDRDQAAIAMLREALARDPDNGSVWGTLALAYQRSAEFGPAEREDRAVAECRAAAARSLALAPENRDALVAVALIAPVYGNWLSAEQSYARTERSAPQHAALLAGRAKLLAEVGRFRDTVRVTDALFEIEPMAPAYHWRRALALWGAGRPQDARMLIGRARAIWPTHVSIWATAFWLEAYSDDPKAAPAILDDAIGRNLGGSQREFMLRSASALIAGEPPDDAFIDASRKAAAAATNMAEQAMAVASRLGAVDHAFEIANAYHFGEGFEVAPARMEQGANIKRAHRKTLPLFWPPMASARKDPRFDQLTARLGLARYWIQSRSMPDFLE